MVFLTGSLHVCNLPLLCHHKHHHRPFLGLLPLLGHQCLPNLVLTLIKRAIIIYIDLYVVVLVVYSGHSSEEDDSFPTEEEIRTRCLRFEKEEFLQV